MRKKRSKAIPGTVKARRGGGTVKNVVAYCRVSTDHDDQVNSLESQKRFFNDYIKNNPEWNLVEIYADEAVIIGLS